MPLNSPPKDRATRARVLVADDHQRVLDRVVELLSSEFSVVGTVTNGAALVDATAALLPDVLVVDISMPGMSGIEAAREIRRRGSSVPIVCLTCLACSEALDDAFAAGAIAYVAKTSMVADLVPAIRAALEGHRFVSASDRPERSRPT